MSNNQLAIIQKQIVPIAERAIAMKIATTKDMVEATEILSQLNKINDKIIQEKEKVTVPLNQALKAERNRWKPAEEKYTEAIQAIRDEMENYQTELVRIEREKQQKIADRVARGTLKVETAIRKLDEVETPETEIATTAGLVQFAEVKVLKIVDDSLIPREYLIVDEKAILDALKAGKVVPGAELETKQQVRNYR